jgi:ATP/maltotriose-dependent transcriptional regulator MalT
MIRQHFAEGFAHGVSLKEGLHVFPQVEDPRPRSAFLAMAAFCTALRGEYAEASTFIGRCIAEIEAYDLDFARPHALWTVAFIELGLRRFGACERTIQRIEDMTRGKPLDYHVLNARTLQARLALQTGQLDVARELVGLPATETALPYIHGEYHATRALVLAATGEPEVALREAREAEDLSAAVEVRVLASAATAAVAVQGGDDSAADELWRLAGSLGTWDPLVAACRASPELALALSRVINAKPRLAALYRASNDHGLARRSGLRARATETPAQILTPREFEVLELLARGFRNKDVAQALVISQSTTKVHVRHIFEKLGVRSRTEAVARFTAGNG